MPHSFDWALKQEWSPAISRHVLIFLAWVVSLTGLSFFFADLPAEAKHSVLVDRP